MNKVFSMGKNLYSLISYASMASSMPTSLLSADKTNSFGNFGNIGRRVNLGHVLLANVCLRTFLGFSWKRKSMEKLWKCYGIRAHGEVESIW